MEYYGDAWKAYMALTGEEGTKEDFEERYQGSYESERDFAESLLDAAGELASLPEHLQYYFDYDSFASDLFISDFECEYINGECHVFHR